MSLRGIGASTAAGLLAAVTAAAATPAAMACSCVPPSAATVDRADAVFTGTVTARPDPSAGDPMQSGIDPITYSIAVDGELRGDVDATATVVTPRDSASCGVDLEVGKRYLVVADRPEDGGDALMTGLCQGTQALPAGAPLPDFARGLQAVPPAPAPMSDLWRAPFRVSGPARGTEWPGVAIGPSGTATAVWGRTTYVPEHRETIATSRLFAASTSADGSFGTPEVISGDGELAVGGRRGRR